MNDDRFERSLREAARDYNLPPETPRDAIWARIEGARRMRGGRWRRVRDTGGLGGTGRRRAWLRWGVGFAAALAVGVGIGRFSAAPPEPEFAAMPSGSATAEPGPGMPLRMLAVEHLSQAETLLTTFRAEAGGGRREEVAEWAGDLLLTTRLLLDSPAANDAHLGALLRDLELVLAQVARLAPETSGAEGDFAAQAMERNNMLLRLRTAVPAGSLRAET